MVVTDLRAVAAQARSSHAAGGRGGGGDPPAAIPLHMLRQLATPAAGGLPSPVGGGVAGSRSGTPLGRTGSTSLSNGGALPPPHPPPLPYANGSGGSVEGGGGGSVASGVTPTFPAGGGGGPAVGLPSPNHTSMSSGNRAFPQGEADHHHHQQQQLQAPLASSSSDYPPPGEPLWEGWSASPSPHHPEIWEAPNDSFEAFVADIVQHRIGKFVIPQPTSSPYHISRIAHEDALALNRKIVREVIEKERQAYEDRLKQGIDRPIERKKLENNVREFVRQSIKRFHSTRLDQAAGGVGATL